MATTKIAPAAASPGLPFLRRFARGKVLLGMIHLPPLPGSPLWAGGSVERIIDGARRDAEAILEGGLDGWILENYGDVPFFPDRVPPYVLTVMTRIALALPRGTGASKGVLTGVNVLRNDALGALAVAAAALLDLIRVNVHTGAMVTDQGIIQGRAAETLRERARLGAPVAIAADVLVKHAAPLGGGGPEAAAWAAKDLAERGLADALIVSGPATGAPADLDRLRTVRTAVPGKPLLVGSGADAASIGAILEIADGAIIGTSLKKGGDVHAPVDRRRVRAILRAAGRN